jgi:hypothetical protein
LQAISVPPRHKQDAWRALEGSRSNGGVHFYAYTPSACVVLQELFDDPVVCADGYTYSRAAISQWLQSGHGTSPMTNLPLSNRELRPNYTLRSAALEWQEARQARASFV